VLNHVTRGRPESQELAFNIDAMNALELVE
jgi:hypothetical protein